MTKSILVINAMIFIVTFSACKKEVTLSYTGDIVVDLGSTDKDVLKYVTSSDGSAVSISEIK